MIVATTAAPTTAAPIITICSAVAAPRSSSTTRSASTAERACARSRGSTPVLVHRVLLSLSRRCQTDADHRYQLPPPKDKLVTADRSRTRRSRCPSTPAGRTSPASCGGPRPRPRRAHDWRIARALAVKLLRTAAPDSPANDPAAAISRSSAIRNRRPSSSSVVPHRVARQAGLPHGPAQLARTPDLARPGRPGPSPTPGPPGRRAATPARRDRRRGRDGNRCRARAASPRNTSRGMNQPTTAPTSDRPTAAARTATSSPATAATAHSSGPANAPTITASAVVPACSSSGRCSSSRSDAVLLVGQRRRP